MDYEKAYNEALERARQVHTTNVDENKKSTEYIFPELKESEDERIRKVLVELVKCNERCGYFMINNTTTSAMLAWLEKQGKQNSVNKVIPKFNVGDWIIFYGDTLRISEIVEGCYRTVSTTGLHNSYDWNLDNTARLWTLADAKDGDVLVDNERPFIFKGFLDSKHPGYPVAYGGINAENLFFCSVGDYWWTDNKDDVKPATKEERKLLFQKIKEDGYEWNENTKELKRRSL